MSEPRDNAEEIAWAAMHAADECDHSTHYASTNPETNADRECLATHIAAALRSYVEKERQWWVEALDADRPCVPAGTPNGSCRHTSQMACVLVAASRREREEER